MALITITGEEEEFDWVLGTVYFPLFDADIEVSIHDKAPVQYAERCAEAVQNLSASVVDELCAASIRYCEDIRKLYLDEGWDFGVPEGVSGRAILDYVSKDGTLNIDPPEGDGVGFRFELNCDWEEEHGLEWSILNSEVVYVGSFSDENPWRGRDYFKTASWNYAQLA